MPSGAGVFGRSAPERGSILEWLFGVVLFSLLLFLAPQAGAQELEFAGDLPSLPLGADSASRLAGLGIGAAEDDGSRQEVRKGPFRWRTALREALFFTGVMHGFRLATETGTRDALNGRWYQDYIHSVGELRGWGGWRSFYHQ